MFSIMVSNQYKIAWMFLIIGIYKVNYCQYYLFFSFFPMDAM